MSRYLLKISYDGTAYHGWQVQPNGVTVQQVLCEKLAEITKEPIGVTGCSRTDSGVHAKEFYCHFDCDKNIPEKAFVLGLNAILPSDIAVLGCIKVPADFHARYSAKGKEYVYTFFDGEILSPFYRNFAYKTDRKIDVRKMNKFCESICGTHDFAAFSSAKRTVEDTVRTVYYCHAQRSGDFVKLTVRADGFLYNMVRIIAGTALEASYGKIKDFKNIFSRDDAGVTLPAHALILNKVFYGEEDDIIG
ncbi:MAG: tRNA pseudouridine(38-40) synthase TruA [Clostridiales bacterium]|nr:tRNA pseudouridine(38-40) synthase TruA [Candidatus Equinaster intestinalis]